jgi:predicted PurR-regulated permease PerM
VDRPARRRARPPAARAATLARAAAARGDGAAPSPAGRPAYPRHVDVGWSSLLTVAALLVGTVVAYDLARAVNDTLVHLLLAVAGALALDRVVRLVERWARLGRAAAVTLVVGLGTALVAGLAALLVPAVVEQGRLVGEDAPAVLDDLVELPVVGRALEENDVPAQAQRWIDDFPDRFADANGLLDTAQAAGLRVAAVLQTLLLLFLLLAEGPALVAAARRFLPDRWLPAAERVGRSVHVVIGRYAAGSVLLALLAGVAAFSLGLALSVPLAALAALWAFLWNFVPQLGGVVGGAGLVALALTTGVGTALTAAVIWLVYVQVENRVVQPVVVGRAVSLSPLTTMVVALVGVAAAGLIGAVLAIPLVAAVNAARLELRGPT